MEWITVGLKAFIDWREEGERRRPRRYEYMSITGSFRASTKITVRRGWTVRWRCGGTRFR